ncbi:hypothetical protein BX661DRAFT_168036 [Kickxella alabastrina]|uniref:uncharacterized protein n=1 Tax=Kickxella alabastrina TaxID=61397 RepID=UPI002220F212|nr:uncharacterized protein BX661DRAFT_168036 [Kickxella alabastrina]KAI7834837.1 hypothetical protein BX661DRAFT_168036 [Kickxella alabastrina]
MSGLSIFQTLPWHIIEPIVGYLLYINRHELSFNKSLAAAIPHSCHIWRSVFISKTCDKLHLNFAASNQTTHTFPNWPQALAQPKFSANYVIKTVRVDITKWVLTMGDRALTRPLGPPCAYVTFPAAHVLDINIPNAYEPSPSRDANWSVALQNIGAFLQRPKQMALAIQTVNIL